uniref:Uncharacterized protein LOC111115499 isoform X2 n=1 Tax=Crassostrea virginica TaxID=6565 RepID=A0A8B8C306_CRAVI|nr:uncharacterized protein LOC111115499 isoform X2 [Crassostrea virginica]
MASGENFKNVEVKLQNGEVVSVHVSADLLGQYHSTDPTIKNMAEKLIVQLAVEQLADRERSCEEEVQKEKSSESDDGLPDIPHTDHVASPTPTSVWAEKAKKCLLDCFRDLSTVTVKNRWLKISQKMGGFGFNFTSEQCRLKIKSLKERHARLSKKRGKSGEGAPEADNLEDEMAEAFSTPDFKPVYVSESGPKNPNDKSDEKPSTSAKKIKKCDEKKTVLEIMKKNRGRCRKKTSGEDDSFEGILGSHDKYY